MYKVFLLSTLSDFNPKTHSSDKNAKSFENLQLLFYPPRKYVVHPLAVGVRGKGICGMLRVIAGCCPCGHGR
jgi:hypothetical protein